MPVIAIGAAIIADVVAGSAIAATVGGIAAISAVTAFEVVAAVGATLGAIGAVTRDKTLSIAGTVIGAIGGIGGLASSAGLLGADAASGAPIFGAAPAQSTGSSFGSVASDASSAATYGPTSAFDTGNAAGAGAGTAIPEGGLSAADAASNGTVNFVNDAASGAALPPATDETTISGVSDNVVDPAKALAGPRADGTGLTAPTDTTNSILNGGVGTTGQSDLIPPPTPPPGTIPPPSTLPGKEGTLNPGFGSGVTATPGVNEAEGTSSLSGGGFFSGILDFAKKNPVVALGALQAGGSLLAGATSTLTPAQVAALNAQAAANQAAANLTAQQTRTLAMPKAVASSTPVTGTPGPLIAGPPPGLINSSPRLAPVTGVPA